MKLIEKLSRRHLINASYVLVIKGFTVKQLKIIKIMASVSLNCLSSHVIVTSVKISRCLNNQNFKILFLNSSTEHFFCIDGRNSTHKFAIPPHQIITKKKILSFLSKRKWLVPKCAMTFDSKVLDCLSDDILEKKYEECSPQLHI